MAMEVYIALFISNKGHLFKEKTYVDCPIDRFCACDGADILFDIDGVMRQKLIDVGEGVKMSEPLKVDRYLASEECVDASLSHQGILAIYDRYDNIIQFTNLNNGKQVVVPIYSTTHIAFYDNMVLFLTERKSLKETTVDDIFYNHDIKTLKIITGTSNIGSWADTSLLNKRRVLYYRNTFDRLFAFNVDTRENIKFDSWTYTHSMISFTGIDCNIKAMYCGPRVKTYVLDMNNTISITSIENEKDFVTMFPSAANPHNITNAVFMNSKRFIKAGNRLNTRDIMKFHGRTVVRVYEDVFLAFDYDTFCWYLFRLVNN